MACGIVAWRVARRCLRERIRSRSRLKRSTSGTREENLLWMLELVSENIESPSAELLQKGQLFSDLFQCRIPGILLLLVCDHQLRLGFFQKPGRNEPANKKVWDEAKHDRNRYGQ